MLDLKNVDKNFDAVVARLQDRGGALDLGPFRALMARRKGASVRESVLDLFPVLRERLRQSFFQLPGGMIQELIHQADCTLKRGHLVRRAVAFTQMPAAIMVVRETVKGNLNLGNVMASDELAHIFRPTGSIGDDGGSVCDAEVFTQRLKLT